MPWDDETFLNKAKVCIGGKITRTAIILLGKAGSRSLSGRFASAIELDLEGQGRDGAGLQALWPAVPSCRRCGAGQRPQSDVPGAAWGTLFPVELLQYDPWVLRETLHNAIAHQDYPISGRINVVEFEDRLVVANMGAFLARRRGERHSSGCPVQRLSECVPGPGDGRPGHDRHHRQRHQTHLSSPEEAFLPHAGLQPDRAPRGSGADHRQGDRREVHPDADGEGRPRPLGRDRPGQGAEGEADQRGRVQGSEGEETGGRARPNLFVSAEIAAATETQADYIKKRAFDKDHYKKMVVAYLTKFGEAKREDIDKLLIDKLSDALDEDQKRNFITNLLQEMRKDGVLDREGAEAMEQVASA